MSQQINRYTLAHQSTSTGSPPAFNSAMIGLAWHRILGLTPDSGFQPEGGWYA
jgi:hypothetical protein